TALNDETTQIRGLETGADDYVSKPISPKVFISRVNALFRRVPKKESKTVEIDGLTIDPEKFVVELEGKEILLAKKEFELLYLLASKPGRVFLRNEILSQVWGRDVIVGDRTIDVHIRKIRKRLDPISLIRSKAFVTNFLFESCQPSAGLRMKFRNTLFQTTVSRKLYF